MCDENVAEGTEASKRSPPGTRIRWVERFGCLLPLVLPAAGIALAWWLIGEWGAIVFGPVMWGVGTFVYVKASRSGAATEYGCFALILVMLFTALVPAVRKVRDAADRIRAERAQERQNQVQPGPVERK